MNNLFLRYSEQLLNTFMTQSYIFNNYLFNFLRSQYLSRYCTNTQIFNNQSMNTSHKFFKNVISKFRHNMLSFILIEIHSGLKNMLLNFIISIKPKILVSQQLVKPTFDSLFIDKIIKLHS